MARRAGAPPDDDKDDEKDELELDDDDDDEDLVVFTAKEAAGAMATIYGFVRPYLGNYRKLLAFVTFGVLVETLFNVIMPLSLKFLIDDALGEEDFQALYKILGVLAAAGIITSIIAVWYERWDARLAAGIIADVRTRLFEHVQNLPSSYFARTKRGEILSRFSIDLAAFEGSVKTFANSAALPFLELIAGIILMLFLNWQLAAVALLVFPITLIGPRILTPKAVQANYEQKLNELALLGTVQENVAAQAVVKAFSLQRRTLGWFTMRNQEVRIKTASAVFLSTMVERTVTISVLLLHLVVLAIGAYLATKGQITIGTFVTFESAFWEVSYNIAHLMHFIPVSIQSAAAVRHIQELLDEPTRGADRPGAPDLPRITNDITFDRVTFAYEGSADAGARQFQPQARRRQAHRDRRSQRLGQEHAAQSDPASLRAGRGAGGDRRRRYPPRDPRIPAQGHGGRVPGEHAVQHVDPREHPARQGRRQRRGGRGRPRARPRSTATS